MLLEKIPSFNILFTFLSLDPQKPVNLTLKHSTPSLLEIAWSKATEFTGPTFYTVTATDLFNDTNRFSNDSSTTLYGTGTIHLIAINNL